MTESGVSQACHRVAVALGKDKKLSVIVEKIKQKLNLSRWYRLLPKYKSGQINFDLP